ncbi:hypothetical protein ACOSQ3_023936 [Xanthoceras sorbifolium]
MRGAKQQAQTAGPGEAYERHRSRPKIWPRIRAGGPGGSGQEAQADPSRRPRRYGQEAQADPGRRPRRYGQEAQAIRAGGPGDPGRRPRRSGQEAQVDPGAQVCGSGRSGAMTPMRSPGAVPGDPGGDPDEEPKCAVPGDPGR